MQRNTHVQIHMWTQTCTCASAIIFPIHFIEFFFNVLFTTDKRETENCKNFSQSHKSILHTIVQ